MDKKDLYRSMNWIDDDILERSERKSNTRTKLIWLRVGVAACLCAAALGALSFLRDKEPLAKDDAVITAEELEAYGYTVAFPAGAENMACDLIDIKDSTVPMAQTSFAVNGQSFVCRALISETSGDISGKSGASAGSLSWKAGSLEMELCEGDESAWVSWYIPETQTQWCVMSEDKEAFVVHTAYTIINTLGYNMDTAPENAENVLYDVFELNGLAVAETAFELNGVSCSFRTAFTPEIKTPFDDISGAEIFDAKKTSLEIGWCQAEMFLNENGEGKIIWFDAAPGLLYSLYAEKGAGEQMLKDMAEELYEPAQNEVG